MNPFPTRYRTLLAAAIVAGGLLAGQQARAGVLFTLNNVKDAKGGTYTGSFEFNAATDTFSSVDITLTSSFLPEGSVSFTNASSYDASFCTLCNPTRQYDEFSFGSNSTGGYAYALYFDIADPLSLTGANALVPDKHHSNYFSDLNYQYVGKNQHSDGNQYSDEELKFVGLVKGSLDTSTVPEPTSMALFGIGLIGLAFAASRRSRKADRLS